MLIGGVVLMITPRCGGGKSEEEKKTTGAIKEYDRTSKVEDQRGDDSSEPRQTYMKSITFEPEVIHTDSEITLRLETSGTIPSNFRIVYVFWKNGKNFQEGDSDTVDPYAYERGDLFVGEVLLMEDDNVAERKRTEGREVINTHPVIEDMVIPEIKGFGIYRIQVAVKDVDNDPITIRLEGESLPGGLTVDSETSEVVYQMDEAPPEKLQFIIVADDGYGGTDKKQVTVNFRKNPPEKEDS